MGEKQTIQTENVRKQVAVLIEDKTDFKGRSRMEIKKDFS